MSLLSLIVAGASASPFSPPANCPAFSDPDELQAQLERADSAYEALDVDGFVGALQEIGMTLPCLGEPVSPTLAAHYHRTQAMQLWSNGDEEAAIPLLLAARSLEPEFSFPEGRFPEGYPMVNAYAEMEPSLETQNRPPRGNFLIYFDGSPTNARPKARSTLMQQVADNHVIATHLLHPDDPVPYARPAIRRNRLLATSASTLILGVSSVGLALDRRARFYRADLATDGDQLVQLQRQTNGLSARR